MCAFVWCKYTFWEIRTNCGASGGICYQFRRAAANEKGRGCGPCGAEITLYQKKDDYRRRKRKKWPSILQIAVMIYKIILNYSSN